MAKKLDSIVELAAQKTREISANSGNYMETAHIADRYAPKYHIYQKFRQHCHCLFHS